MNMSKESALTNYTKDQLRNLKLLSPHSGSAGAYGLDLVNISALSDNYVASDEQQFSVGNHTGVANVTSFGNQKSLNSTMTGYIEENLIGFLLGFGVPFGFFVVLGIICFIIYYYKFYAKLQKNEMTITDNPCRTESISEEIDFGEGFNNVTEPEVEVGTCPIYCQLCKAKVTPKWNGISGYRTAPIPWTSVGKIVPQAETARWVLMKNKVTQTPRPDVYEGIFTPKLDPIEEECEDFE